MIHLIAESQSYVVVLKQTLFFAFLVAVVSIWVLLMMLLYEHLVNPWIKKRLYLNKIDKSKESRKSGHPTDRVDG